jgi:hypothetical protein
MKMQFTRRQLVRLAVVLLAAAVIGLVLLLAGCAMKIDPQWSMPKQVSMCWYFERGVDLDRVEKYQRVTDDFAAEHGIAVRHVTPMVWKRLDPAAYPVEEALWDAPVSQSCDKHVFVANAYIPQFIIAAAIGGPGGAANWERDRMIVWDTWVSPLAPPVMSVRHELKHILLGYVH